MCVLIRVFSREGSSDAKVAAPLLSPASEHLVESWKRDGEARGVTTVNWRRGIRNESGFFNAAIPTGCEDLLSNAGWLPAPRPVGFSMVGARKLPTQLGRVRDRRERRRGAGRARWHSSQPRGRFSPSLSLGTMSERVPARRCPRSRSDPQKS